MWVDTAGRLIEPVLMLGIGLVVGGIVLMLYSPIFDLANIV
jgi:general secretion pathway protein F